MTKSRFWPLGLAAVALAAVPFVSRAQAAEPAAPAPSPVPGWAEFVESLRTLPDRMLEKLPEDQRADPQVRQEVARLALESLASSAIAAIGADGDHPQFLPAIGQVLNVGQPNADTIYRSAAITPGGTYRITGRRGTLTLAALSQLVPGTGKRDHIELGNLKADRKGRFSLIVSPERPKGYRGDWWRLDPAARQLMIRMVSADWAGEEDPTLTIERIDGPAARGRVPAATLEAKLRALPRQIDTMALMFPGHVAKLRAEGYVNKLKVLTLESGALEGQFYYEGPYELADDEALVIESPVPATCNYRSLILTNDLYETTDWINNHSSLNGAQAAPDGDGRLRIVVSPRDPGVANWLDTAGYNSGLIQGRWTGCDSQPMPEVRLVKLAELDKVLPKDTRRVTPEQREEILRERRRAWQERPVW